MLSLRQLQSSGEFPKEIVNIVHCVLFVIKKSLQKFSNQDLSSQNALFQFLKKYIIIFPNIIFMNYCSYPQANKEPTLKILKLS